jgi:dihydrodiol dehydrogenase / D-xylose 1-dehydrogenase (NADP)
MTGLASQQWSEPVVYEFPLPLDIVALPTECDGEDPNPNHGFNFVNSQGLAYEAAEVNRCFREGEIETPSFSSHQCIEILRLISDVRRHASK